MRCRIRRIQTIITILIGISTTTVAQTFEEVIEGRTIPEAMEHVEALVEADSLADRNLRSVYARLLFETGAIDRAIEVTEPLAESFRALDDRARLANYYAYRGRTEDYERILGQSMRVVRLMMQYGMDADSWVAAGRLMELDGTDPSRVLAHYRRLFEARPDHAEGAVAAGQLALSTHSYDVAARFFHQALETNEVSVDALSGLARAFYESSDGRVDDVLTQLTEIAPDHPTLHLLDAERELDLGNTDAAHDAIQHILSVNPNHIEALSLKLAAHLLEDEKTAASETQQHIAFINPKASAGFRTSGRVISRHYRFQEGVKLQEQALRLNPDDSDARLMLAFDLLRLAEDDRARPHLELVFDADPYNVQAFNLLGVSDALKGFTKLTNPTFRLEMPATEAAVLADLVFELLDEAAAHYQARYDMMLHTPVVLQMFDDHDEFIVRSVGLPGSAGHLGICFGHLITMDSPRARPPGSTNWRQILWHEFVHVITLQKTNNRMPRWLSEGISVYEEKLRDTSWGVPLDPGYKEIIDTSGWPTSETLERYFTQPKSQNELMFGYFASGEFVHAYVDAYGLEALTEALKSIGEGKKAIAALAESARTTADEMDEHFSEHLRERCRPFEMVEGTPKGNPYRLSSDYRVKLSRADRQAEDEEHELAEKSYEHVYSLYPDQLEPLERIVDMWSKTDNREAHERALKSWVSLDARAFKGALDLVEVTDADSTKAWAMDRAFAINPFDLNLLQMRYAHHRSIEDRRAITDIDRLIHLDRARRQTHRLERASTLIAHGDTTSARSTLLTLLEETPNDWPAQRLLLELSGATP